MAADIRVAAQLGLNPSDGRLLSNGSYLAFNCPHCVERGEPTADTKERLHVCVDRSSSRYGYAHCFRCGFKSKVGGVSKGSLDLTFLKKFSSKEKKESPPEPVVLPEDFTPLVVDTYAWKYLIDRGLTPDDIRYYQIGHGTVGRGSSRIVFPDYDIAGKLCYWVARNYFGKTKFKYLNCKADRRTQIYNLGRFRNEGFRSATICEGSISAIAAGRDALAFYGKGYSDSQLATLRDMSLDNIYVALDPDAKDLSVRLAKSLVGFCKGVFLVKMPDGEDPASLGREEFSRLRHAARPYSRAAALRFRL